MDEVWSAGDLVQKGPDSVGTVRLCREKGVKLVTGNHDATLVDLHTRFYRTGKLGKLTKENWEICENLTADDLKYLSHAPPFAVFDDVKLVVVHGGLLPGRPLHSQPPELVRRLQMVNTRYPFRTKWFGRRGHDGMTEADNRREGWVRWTEAYDWDYDIVYGHSTYDVPDVRQNEGCGRTIGIDTGCVYGGSLTAVILPEMKFLTVKAKKVYKERK